MTQTLVTIQVNPESVPLIPSWMGEVVAFAQILTHEGILKAIQEQVRFARARFGYYYLIDFVPVLIGYILSGEPTLLAFYERLLPFAKPFMALFGRNQWPHRSTLSRFLAALDQPTVEALRKLCARRSDCPQAVCLSRRNGGSNRTTMVDGGCGRNQGYCSPACAAAGRVAARLSSSFRSRLRARLPGTQTRRSGAYAHDHSPGAYAPVSGHLWRAWKWRLSGRVVAGDRGDQKLRNKA